jgi:hypothetical protein
MKFNWEAVNESATAALRDGVAVASVSEHDVMLAIHAVEGRPVNGEPIVEALQRMRSPVVASHAVGLLNPELLTRPPLVWPIDDPVTIPLMEEDLVLVHAIDLARFTDRLEDDFRVLDVSLDRGLSTERHGQKGVASVRFVNDVLYGYATIESAVAALREMHDLTKAALDGLEGQPTSPSPEPTLIEQHGVDFFERPTVLLEAKNARYKIEAHPPE